MQHKGTVTLETERLLLRRFVISDAQEAFTNWFSDPEVAMYMRWHAHTDVEQTKKMLSDVITDYAKPHFYRWAITLRAGGEVMGAISLHILDEFDMVADTSYALGKPFWGKGIT